MSGSITISGTYYNELLAREREYGAMLSNLTATQKRCTEQEQKIRDQERELVELRGKQGAPVDPAFGPFIQRLAV